MDESTRLSKLYGLSVQSVVFLCLFVLASTVLIFSDAWNVSAEQRKALFIFLIGCTILLICSVLELLAGLRIREGEGSDTVEPYVVGDLVGDISGDRSVSTERPLGRLTFAEADRYFDQYSQLLINGAKPYEKESRLPAAFDVMKETLMVQAIAWWRGGIGFVKTEKHMAVGLIYLCDFLPDELVDSALVFTPEGRAQIDQMLQSRDIAGLEASRRAKLATEELRDLRIRTVNAEWSQFLSKYRKIYGNN